ncbi:ArdC family protein [Pseudonocardia sp. DLS-67]
MPNRPRSPSRSAAERAARVDALNAKLTTAVQNLTTSEQWTTMLRTAAAFHSYSPRNMLLLWMQAQERGVMLTQVAGYTTWRRLGRSVRAGERGFAVLAPVTRRDSEQDGREDEPTPAGRRRMVGVRVAHVFDIAQTTGQPLLTLHAPGILQAPDAGRLWGPLARLVAGHGYGLLRLPELGDVQGWTDHRGRVVSVRPDIDDARATAILAHELAHIRADHEHRPIGRAQRETEAESAAHVVLTACGIDTTSLAVPYVAGWSRGDPEVIGKAAETVHKVAAGMLADIERLAEDAAVARRVPASRRSLQDERDPQRSAAMPAPPGPTATA